jgi:L-iditol 2-dehydrogenase
MLFREIQMHFSFMNPFTHGRAAQMIADGVIDVSQLISRKISLPQAAGAIAEPALAGEVRAIVVPGM